MFAGRKPDRHGADPLHQNRSLSMRAIPALAYRASSVKHQPRSSRFFFNVGIGSICLSGPDTGGAYCLLEVGLAPGMSVPRHTHTREDEAYFVLVGELEVTVGEEVFILRSGECLMAPRDIPHQLRNSGDVENHYLLVFSPAGLEECSRVTPAPPPDNAPHTTNPPATPVQTAQNLATNFEILFDGDGPANNWQEQEYPHDNRSRLPE